MKALISIRGTQTLDGQTPDVMELTTEGTLEPIADGYKLCYRETAATGMEGTDTALLIGKERVILKRTGSNCGMLVLEKHRRHHSHYATPYGMLDLGTYTNILRSTVGDNGGELDFAYTLDFNGSVNSTHTVHITIREETSKCLLS